MEEQPATPTPQEHAAMRLAIQMATRQAAGLADDGELESALAASAAQARREHPVLCGACS